MVLQNFEDAGKKPVTVGPWGGQDGSCWDDGFYSTVRQVVISYGPTIGSIQFEYDKKGTPVWSEKHGGRGVNHTEKVSPKFFILLKPLSYIIAH